VSASTGDAVAFLCPHPDDEAIFCGGTIRALADAGHRVVIVAATSGDTADGRPDAALRELRRRELEAAGEILGATVHHLGYVATVESDLLVDVRAHIDAKRAAFAAHASQLPEHSETMRLDTSAFEAVYGIEWFNRVGPAAVLDRLG
jgi:LmbE family N-acetylglucosaminyl deacetylase